MSVVSGWSLAFTLATLAAAVPATAQVRSAATTPTADRRVGLRAGRMDAAQALWNLRLVAAAPKPARFMNDTDPGDFGFLNSDLAFTGHYVIQGNFHGLQVWDIAQPAKPVLVTSYICPDAQNDVSVYRNLLFTSGEDFDGRLDCGTQGVADTVSTDRMRGIRIFDISDITHPKPITAVQTCRGSHTHTLLVDPNDTANVYIYVSGGAPVRPASELAGCSALAPDKDPNSELFRIEVIQVPVAHPEQARVVSKPAILADLAEPHSHPEAAQDIAHADSIIAAARAQGAFIARIRGRDRVVPPRVIQPLLDGIVKAGGGNGPPTAMDSAALRGAIQSIVDTLTKPAAAPPTGPGGSRPGPVQCHDITVYPAIGRAGGACAGYGVLLDIRDAIFTVAHDTMTFRSYYKIPAAQTPQENCVAHNGSLIPVPGRDLMAQGWYQGGVSVFDFTDPAHPQEIAYFDRGPMDSTKLVGAGSWAGYWYNGYIVSSEIGRGLDILELLPSPQLSANEIAAAKLVHFDQLNVQDQPQLVWPASFVVARAYLDQLERTRGLAAARVTAVRASLARAERLGGGARRDALTRLAGELDRDAGSAADAAKTRTLAGEVRQLARS